MPQVENIRMFVRVYELGSMSEAARDQRVSPAVASSRIAKLEKHLGVRLFNRTTRRIHTTEHGQAYYQGATKILQAIAEAEAAVATIANHPRGSIFVAAPLGVGKRFIAPHVPDFKDAYPDINVRLRMSDRNVDITKEGIDIAFHLGNLQDSALRLQKIAECPRVLCAAPDYLAKRGTPVHGQDLIDGRHDCLLLRYPGAAEQDWALITETGPRKFNVQGPFESDDGDVLTDWAPGRARHRQQAGIRGRRAPQIRGTGSRGNGNSAHTSKPVMPLSTQTVSGPEDQPVHRIHDRPVPGEVEGKRSGLSAAAIGGIPVRG